MLFVQVPDPVITVQLGGHDVLFPPDHDGRVEMNYFPDEAPAFLSQPDEQPFRFLMTAANYTVLMEGPNLENARFVAIVFGPSADGTFDNDYAGITSFYRFAPGSLLGFYHAERKETTNGRKWRYWSIGLASSSDDGKTFQKVGQILSPALPDPLPVKDNLGIGDVCVIEKRNYLYAYYTDITCRPQSVAAGIGLARCKKTEATSLTSWRKCSDGRRRYEVIGLGGVGRAILAKPNYDISQPHVIHVKKWQLYLMVCCVCSHSDHERQTTTESGIYLFRSSDGTEWTEVRRLFEDFPIPIRGRSYAAHPSLYLAKIGGSIAEGWLLYCFSEQWKQEPTDPGKPHYMCYRPIRLTLVG
jgi:hypothetical protein